LGSESANCAAYWFSPLCPEAPRNDLEIVLETRCVITGRRCCRHTSGTRFRLRTGPRWPIEWMVLVAAQEVQGSSGRRLRRMELGMPPVVTTSAA
jgi:hypothetical protein